MKRKVTSLLLCFIMLFSVMSVAVPAYAAPVTSTALTVTADKATAAPGETITYTITMGPVSDLGSIQMVLDIPSGLTYVSGSGSLAAGLKAKLGFDTVDYTEGTKEGKPRIMINGVASAANYESATDTVIATFKCTVDAGATGTLEVGLTELEFYSVDLTDNTSRFSVVTAKVTVNAPTVTTYTVGFNANGGTGAMADVTGVSAGAYTLPANGFIAPDGKRFVGWATSATGSVITTATYNVTENVTFYAIWEEIPTSHPAKPTLGITGTYTYNGSAQTVTVTGFDSATMLITGNVGTNAGTYTASVTSKSGRWADGTSTPVTIEWSIGRKTVTPVIRVTGTYTYTGTPVEPTFTVEDGGVVISSSEYSRTFTDNDAVGTGKITVSDKTGGNYEILTTSQTFEIGAPTPPPTVYTSTEIKITADKTDAKAGDEITFTITMGPVSELGSIQMKLKLPAGLTVVAGSCQLAAGLKATLGFDDISFTEGTDYVITGVASAANYRSDADTVIATFKCKVDTSAPGNLKADLKELEFYSVDLIDNTSRFSVVPATITVADSRTKVNKVEGNSDISTILVYGGAYKKPSVNVTTGAPAFFNINSGNGNWLKKNSAGIWGKYTGATFTEGTYIFDCQVRIDDAAGLTHVFDSAGVTVTVDGVAWTAGTLDVENHYSLVWVQSPEYTVTKPATTTYTVSFNANGGTGTMAAVTGVAAGAYTLPANGFTAPAGKQFKGWATSATGSVITTATYNVTGNVTFYAVWENIPVTTYTVSFNANGGTGAMADVTGVAAGAYTLPANGFTAPAGKQFKGWATSATGEVIATATYNVTGNVTFYAIWENIYTITFDANGGTGAMAAVTGVTAGEYTLPANGFTAPSCKKFKGWATSENGEVIATATYNVTGNVTFYAIWEDDPAAHNYGTEWYKNSEKHWHECAVCHTKKDEAPHVYDNDCDTTCNVCGAVREITHNYADVWSNDENNHWHECTVCHTRKDEAPHVYDNDCDTTCNVCGAVREVTHNYAEVWSNDENNHWHECTVCHTRKDEAAHVPGPEATEETAQVCTVCGYVLKAPLGHTHKPKLVEKVEPTCTENGNIAYYRCHCGKLYYDSAATREITDLSKIVLFSKGHVRCHEWHTTVLYHWQECTVCNERIDTAFHRPGADATETTPQTCPVCGYVLKEALGHTHKFDQKNTDAKYLKSAANCNSGAVYYYSCACGEKGTETFVSGEKLNHTFKTEWSTDENNHWHECSLCGTVKDKAAHTFEWKIDKKPTAGEAGSKHEECTVCGYKKGAVTIEPTGTTTTTPPAVTTTEGKAETPEKSGAAWVWAIVAVVVLGGGAAVVIVLVRKKKKA